MSDLAKRLDAVLKDCYINDAMLEAYEEQRRMQRETMLLLMEKMGTCPNDPVVRYLQATAPEQADIIDRTIDNLKSGLAKRPEGGCLAELDRRAGSEPGSDHV